MSLRPTLEAGVHVSLHGWKALIGSHFVRRVESPVGLTVECGILVPER